MLSAGRYLLFFGFGGLLLNILSAQTTSKVYPVVLIICGLMFIGGLVIRVAYVFSREDE